MVRVRTCLKVFWLSKDSSTGHRERKKEEEVGRKRGETTIIKTGEEWTSLYHLGQLKTGQEVFC